MSEHEADTKLTKDNWDSITLRPYHLEFLNRRNAIRAALYELLQADNEIKYTNTEIQILKTNFDSELSFLEDEVKRMQESEYVEAEDKLEYIAELVKKIETVNSKFSSEIEKYQLIKEKRCHSVSENVDKLFELKTEFRSLHHNQVDNLRRFRIFCDREIRPAVEVRLKSIDRKFCDELFYIDSCEKGLKHIFSLIDDRSSHSGVCPSVSSTMEASDICQDFYTDFAWMRNEQLVRRSELFDYFKAYLAKDLIAALAAMHVVKPEEPIKFVANYLKHLKNNDFRVKRQEAIFAAGANTGGKLFPDQIMDR